MLVVALMGALELQELVVTALAAVGVGAATVRASGVNRAAPRLAVEKAADGPVNLVFVVAQHALVATVGGVVVGELVPRFIDRQLEMLRQALSLSAPFSYSVYDSSGNLVYSGRLGETTGPQLPTGTYRVVINTSPEYVLENVVVSSQQTTVVSVEQQGGSVTARVGG